MKVFISSVISGFEAYREAAAHSARLLGREVLRAEDFGASPDSPQRACLAAVRAAYTVLLLLGGRYGDPQASGLSPTHEEYREARERGLVLAFVQSDVSREKQQEAFIGEVRQWATGHYTAEFATPNQLGDAVTQALHKLALSQALGPADEGEMLGRAEALIPKSAPAGAATLCVVVATGPRQQILRPTELEEPELARRIMQEAMFGARGFLGTEQTKAAMKGSTLIITQPQASILVDELGTVQIVRPAHAEDQRSYGLPVLIEEDVRDAVEKGLAFAGWLLDTIDPLGRISDVVPVAAVVGGGHLGWRTRAEHQKSPNTVAIRPFSSAYVLVHLSPARRHRGALTAQTKAIAEDLTVLLRRDLRA
ncbi:MAG: DUF4062 domain-containing protein [Chloroflexi bacterium]|nr:MAG: DUF4062 domain-containing protein [Chloroflexota bacterium]